MHQTVHDEGGTRHISGVFKKRDEQIKKEDVRQEDQHASDSADDTVDDKIP